MIKLLIVLDKSIMYPEQISEGLALQRQDYEASGIAVTEKFQVQDLSDLKWVEYDGQGHYGVDWAWLKEQTKDKKEFYSVAFVFHDENWSRLGMTSEIWGWSAGFFNGVHVQLIRVKKDRVIALDGVVRIGTYYAFSMELMHSWNEYIQSKMGMSQNEFNNLFNADFDEGVVHGKTPPWRRYQYRPVIEILKPYLLKFFKTMLKLERQKGRREVFAVINGRNYYMSGEAFADFVAAGLASWADIVEVDEEINLDNVIK